jgi:uncharacterized protein (TIGR03437 family)
VQREQLDKSKGGFVQHRNKLARRGLIAALIISLFFASFTLRPSAESQTGAGAESQTDQSSARSRRPVINKGWTHEKRAREAWLWHQLNQERLARTHVLGAAALGVNVVNTDTNDISVIQDDGTIVTSQNFFDLNGRAVQFTPAGSGYTVTSFVAAFDTNLGTKLDLTTAPAVNPKQNPTPEPGDDAYILQDLGFSFSFYGTSFSNVAVSSNGFLTFRPNGVSQQVFDLDSVESGEGLSILQTGLPRIAPYWHDLDARQNSTQGNNGIFIRRDSDRVVVTWNNIRDFPNDPAVDNGVHRFQVTLFQNGNILFTYDSAQLTSRALAGLSPGNASSLPSLVDLSNPPSGAITAPIAEFFSTSVMVDTIGAVQAFYTTHPGRDVYDFVYLITDFDFSLGDAFAFYLPLRNDATGIGQAVGQSSAAQGISSQRIQGILNLSNLNADYPDFPTTRFLVANHALSIMGQEQGHRWLSYIDYPGAVPNLLLGRDDAHWSFFYSIESTMSNPAARRSSSAEGSVWRENGDGTFTSVNLIDGYSRLDQYLMGLRPASDVPDTFVITNLTNTGGRNRESNPRPNVTVAGTKQTITINQIIQANGARVPDATAALKSFRAAVVLLVRQGTQPSAATLNKVTRYRLAWESYFAQSTDYRASINTGLADQTTSRVIAAASAASYVPTLAPGEIGALFGIGLTSGGTESAGSQPLPTILAGTQVFISGVVAPLYFASPSQINFQVPATTAATTTSFSPPVPSSTATIEVFSNGQLIRAGAVQVAPTVPAVFTINQSGSGPAAALDGLNFTGPPFAATQQNGQPNIIAVFGTGFGADATDVDGDVKASVQAQLDGNPATVQYAGRAPGFTGLNQINVQFTAGLTSGTHTLVITRNGIAGNPTTIAIR